MPFVHARNTYVMLGGVDLSAFVNSSEFSRSADSHDVTTYGRESRVYQGGLMDATFNAEGIYDNGTIGPRDTIEPLIGTTVALVRRVEGTGTGRPVDTCQVLVTSYVETSPVDDMVTWSVECQVSGEITSANQV